MSSKKWIVVGAVILALLILPVAWYLASPLFINNTVDEAFPFTMPDTEEMAAMSDDDMKALEIEFLTAVPDEMALAGLNEAERTAVEAKVQAAAVVMNNSELAEPMPTAAAAWTAVAGGNFTGADEFHQGSGTITLYTLGAERMLRFEDFDVTNGPDLHVILSRNPNPTERSDIGEDYIDLGQLKGNQGNQNYDIPADINLDDYQGVVIYCLPFHVVFAIAELTP